MTPEQIKNFREALCFTLGPYALIMPDEQVIKIRDSMQERLDKEGGINEEKTNTTDSKEPEV
jgi:hypothetical protein